MAIRNLGESAKLLISSQEGSNPSLPAISWVLGTLRELEIPRFSKGGVDLSLAILIGYKEAGVAQSTYQRYVKRYFPDKRDGIKLITHLSELKDEFQCNICKEFLPANYFSCNVSKSSGLARECRTCMYEVRTYPNARHYAALYRALKIQRTPKWADLAKIKQIYKECPEGCHVDHIIPLNGKEVSGLHVEYNLQYLSVEENLRKSNKYAGLV